MLNLTSYEANSQTMAIIGTRDNSGKVHSRILEENAEYVTTQRPRSIIDKSCRYFGSSLRGRQEGTRELTGITHKPPIAIDPNTGIYMFPTSSPYKDICAWFSHTYIEDCEAINSERTKVFFTNGLEVQINISRGSFENQLNRTAQFRYLLSKRIYSAPFKELVRL